MRLSVAEIEKAAKAIAEATRRTPLLQSPAFEKRIRARYPIYFKVESLQYTGSFKVRGALNKLMSILPSAKKVGVITASAGNHAQGVAYHSQRLGVKAKIVMPVTTPLVKVNNTKQWGAEVVLFGESYQEAYQKALELKEKEGREYIHAFDDEAIMAGQGSLALEVLEDVPDIKVFVCPIGGGGLIGGCGSYFKAKKNDIRVIGVQAEGCSTFLPSLKAGKPITLGSVNTIAEGMSAKRMGDLSFEVCREVIDEAFTVSDEEISEGILWALENEKLFIEGCGGATLAALIKNPQLVTGPTVVVLSGGNLDVTLLERIIERGLIKSGRMVLLEVIIPDVAGSLVKLLNVFAEQKASVDQVVHERSFTDTSLKEVVTRISLETQGPEHVERIKAAIAEHGYRVRFL